MDTVWKHPGLVVKTYREGCKGVFTNLDLDRNEVILVERVVSGTHADLSTVVAGNRDLYKELHPRGRDWSPDMARATNEDLARNETLQEKLYCNCFQSGTPGLVHLGFLTSYFNHRCAANVVLFAENENNLVPSGTNDKDTLFCIVTVDPVPARAQLFLCYDPGVGHGDGWTFSCDCKGQEEEGNINDAKVDDAYAHLTRRLQTFRDGS